MGVDEMNGDLLIGNFKCMYGVCSTNPGSGGGEERRGEESIGSFPASSEIMVLALVGHGMMDREEMRL